MMDIQQQVRSSFRPHHLETIEGCFLQIEWLHKLVLISCQRLVTHLCNRNLHGNLILYRLHDLIVFRDEMRTQLGMVLHHAFYSLSQLLRIN